MTNSNLKFKTVVKDRLFYNRFEYGISFALDEASALRDLNHKEIDATIERRREWRSIAMQRWKTTGKLLGKHQNILGRRRKDITEETVENLHAITELLLNVTTEIKLVVSANQGHVYTNDLWLIDQLSKFKFLGEQQYTRAHVNRPKNTITLKNPKHKFRSYFKITKLTNDQKMHLAGFLLNQTTVRLSPALDEWLVGPFNRTQEYFFIDHNETAWLTMLALVLPGIIRKTQQIIQAK